VLVDRRLMRRFAADRAWEAHTAIDNIVRNWIFMDSWISSPVEIDPGNADECGSSGET
jgi:hypothetical protein